MKTQATKSREIFANDAPDALKSKICKDLKHPDGMKTSSPIKQQAKGTNKLLSKAYIQVAYRNTKNAQHHCSSVKRKLSAPHSC